MTLSDMATRAPWLIQRFPAASTERVQKLIDQLQLHTVCRSASCPNQGECFHAGTATFLILGSVCTRDCRFCGVPKGTPASVEPQEPLNLATAVKTLGLQHVVVTSVTRDDLPEGGASHYAACIREIRRQCPGTTVEVLTPDFAGNTEALATVFAERPEVFSHNVETVPRLYPLVRPSASYQRSLRVLRSAAAAGIRWVKSGMMLGLGESETEALTVFADLRRYGVTSLTLGQYLRPTRQHLPVVDYVHPTVFNRLAEDARRLGFSHVASGPLVRSSYHAGEVFAKKVNW